MAAVLRIAYDAPHAIARSICRHAIRRSIRGSLAHAAGYTPQGYSRADPGNHLTHPSTPKIKKALDSIRKT